MTNLWYNNLVIWTYCFWSEMLHQVRWSSSGSVIHHGDKLSQDNSLFRDFLDRCVACFCLSWTKITWHDEDPDKIQVVKKGKSTWSLMIRIRLWIFYLMIPGWLTAFIDKLMLLTTFECRKWVKICHWELLSNLESTSRRMGGPSTMALPDFSKMGRSRVPTNWQEGTKKYLKQGSPHTPQATLGVSLVKGFKKSLTSAWGWIPRAALWSCSNWAKSWVSFAILLRLLETT